MGHDLQNPHKQYFLLDAAGVFLTLTVTDDFIHVPIHIHTSMCLSFIVIGIPTLLSGVDAPSLGISTRSVMVLTSGAQWNPCDLRDFQGKVTKRQLLPGSSSLALSFGTQPHAVRKRRPHEETNAEILAQAPTSVSADSHHQPSDK